MPRRTLTLLLGAGLSAVALPVATTAAAATAGPPPAAADQIAGAWVVQLSGVPAPLVAAVADGLTREAGRVGFTYTAALRGFSVRGLSEQQALALRSSPLVKAVTPDRRITLQGVQSGAQYDLDRIDQRAGTDGSYTYARTGRGVHAYDLDTGITPGHIDFGGRASVGTDVMGDGHNGIDCNGHGTHTAGTIGGAAHGVAKEVSLVGVRVLDCSGSGSSSQIVAGIDWVTSHAIKPAVANMSLGSSVGTDSAIDNAVAGSIASGIPYAVAAGNGYGNGLYAQNACSTSPADVPTAITVSATDASDTKPIWANIGSCVDIFAPGVGVVSDWYTSSTATQTEDGTSMSTPHVTGAAALVLEQNPGFTPAQVTDALVGNATTGAVKSPGSGSPNKLLYTGFLSGGTTPSPSPTPSTSPSPSPSPSPSVVPTSAAGDPDPGTPTLTSGQARSGTGAAQGGFSYLKIAVPAGASRLAVSLTGPACGLLSCNPDLDLYVKQATKPTTSSSDASSATGSNSESVSVTSPAAAWWYVGVYTYSGSGGSWSVTATVS